MLKNVLKLQHISKAIIRSLHAQRTSNTQKIYSKGKNMRAAIFTRGHTFFRLNNE